MSFITYLRGGVFLYTGPQQHFDSLEQTGLWESIPIHEIPYSTRLEIKERLDAKGVKRQKTGVNEAGKNCWSPNEPCGKACRPKGTCKQGDQPAAKTKGVTLDDVRAKLLQKLQQSEPAAKKAKAKSPKPEPTAKKAKAKPQRLADILKENNISRKEYDSARDKAVSDEIERLRGEMGREGADTQGIEAQIGKLAKMGAVAKSKAFGARAIEGIIKARQPSPPKAKAPKAPKASKTPQETAPKPPKAPKAPKPPKASKTPQESAPKPPKPPQETAPKKEPGSSGASPTLKPRDYNPHAKPDLPIKEFKTFWEDKQRLKSIQDTPVQTYEQWAKSASTRPTKKGYQFYLGSLLDKGIPVEESAFEAEGIKVSKRDKSRIQSNRDAVSATQQRVSEIQKAIDHPLLTDEEASGFKHKMTTDEADAYTAGSFMGNLRFYHGNGAGVIDSMDRDGVQPDRNNRGIYGKGAYFGASPEIGREYQSAAALEGGGSGLVEVATKVKNPAVISTAEYAKISQFFFPDSSDNDASDSEAVQQYFRAMGHDSIYLENEGYFITFDPRQTVITDVSRAEAKSPEEDKLRAFYEDQRQKRKQGGDNRSKFENSRTGKALKSLAPRTLNQGGKPDEDL